MGYSGIRSDLSVLKTFANLEITAVRIENDSPVIGKSIVELQLRNKFGLTIVALMRNKELYDNPDPETIFNDADIVYLMGRSEQIASATELFAKRSLKDDAFIES
jgi:CPA2 family monovalent cation:H+ antiporter-2